MKADRYYKFWDKTITRFENKKNFGALDSKGMATQIERSCKTKMITEEQRDSLLERLEAVTQREIKESPDYQEWLRNSLAQIKLERDLGVITEEEATERAKELMK